MTTGQVKLGALGCSSIARRRTLPAVAATPGLSLATVASRSASRAAEFAAEFGCAAATYEELLADPGIDAVYISVPTGLHYEWAKRALESGKHVLGEKPLTTDAAQTRELTALAGERGVVLRENFSFLHHPQHERVRKMVVNGRIGRPRSFTAALGIPPRPETDIRYDAALGGGALLDIGVYPLRLAQLMLGDRLEVAGAALRVDEERGVDLSGSALLVSDTGVFADVEFGFEHSYRSRYEFWGSDGSLTLDRAFITPAGYQPTLRVDEKNDDVTELSLPAADQFQACVESFVRAVVSGSLAAEDEWTRGAAALAALVSEFRAVAVEMKVKRTD